MTTMTAIYINMSYQTCLFQENLQSSFLQLTLHLNNLHITFMLHDQANLLTFNAIIIPFIKILKIFQFLIRLLSGCFLSMEDKYFSSDQLKLFLWNYRKSVNKLTGIVLWYQLFTNKQVKLLFCKFL